MDQATLVSPDINAGQEALAALDAAQVKQITALLMVSSEYEDWRLVLSSPSLDQTHPLKAYEKVTEVLRGRFVYTLPPILILPTKDAFIRELRRIFSKTKDVTGRRLGGQTIGNRYISNAYVYRVQ
ncbi:hypothetical protein [Granulicella arctica]|uniref:Uncharacterized protein n=1 Tax=Granulicella arctica TaxID=940613 RepID=A0A7Y9PDD9_9BACT|nr:hypothetical protein [Granulicella arctica]NYF77866.1 hypothetical protein [Granulicella arctica]